jgi:hypothetical protein
MAFATYPLKGSVTLSNFKTLLEADTVFNSLSSTQQNALINSSTQRIAALRNSLSKIDYDFDTIGNADIDVETMGYTKYVRYAIIKAGTTYEGTEYLVDTVLLEQGPTSFTGAVTVDDSTPDQFSFISSGEFVLGTITDAHDAAVIVTRDNDNSITVNIVDLVDVCILEIYRI